MHFFTSQLCGIWKPKGIDMCFSQLHFDMCVSYSVCWCFSTPSSVWLPVRAGDWSTRDRDAVSFLHGSALCPDAALCLPHPASVHPQRDQHPEIHQVRFFLTRERVCTVYVHPESKHVRTTACHFQIVILDY